MPEEEQLTATLQLSLHEHGQELNGLGDLFRSIGAIDEQVHDHEVGLFGVDPLQLTGDVAVSQRTSLNKLDVPGAVTGVLRHAGHLMSIVANDPD